MSVINKSPNGTYTATSGQTLFGIATSTITFQGDTLTVISSSSIAGQKRWDYKYDFIIQDEVITEWNIEKYTTNTDEQMNGLREQLEKTTNQSARDSIRSRMSNLEIERQSNLQKMRTALRQEERRRGIDTYKPQPSYILLYNTTAENATLIALNNVITKEVEVHNFRYINEQDIVIIDETPFYK